MVSWLSLLLFKLREVTNKLVSPEGEDEECLKRLLKFSAGILWLSIFWSPKKQGLKQQHWQRGTS